MTRQDITDYITDELGAFEGSGIADSPNALQRQITATTDEVARLSKGSYLVFQMDLAVGQAVYCASPLLKIVAATARTQAGASLPLGFLTARDLVEWTKARIVPATGTPRYYASEGVNRIEVYPVPDYTTTGATAFYGLTIEGYGVPGETWAAMNAPCPLPDSQHMGVVYGTLVKRCKQFPKLLSDRLAGYMQEWTWYKGHCESQAALQTRADRRRMREYEAGRGGANADPLDNGAYTGGAGGNSGIIDGGFLG